MVKRNLSLFIKPFIATVLLCVFISNCEAQGTPGEPGTPPTPGGSTNHDQLEVDFSPLKIKIDGVETEEEYEGEGTYLLPAGATEISLGTGFTVKNVTNTRDEKFTVHIERWEWTGGNAAEWHRVNTLSHPARRALKSGKPAWVTINEQVMQTNSWSKFRIRIIVKDERGYTVDSTDFQFE